MEPHRPREMVRLLPGRHRMAPRIDSNCWSDAGAESIINLTAISCGFGHDRPFAVGHGHTLIVQICADSKQFGCAQTATQADISVALVGRLSGDGRPGQVM